MEKVLYTLNHRLRAVDKHKELIKNFKALRTDEERIIFTLDIMLEYDIIPQVCGDSKDAKRSQTLREKGNTMFVSNPLTSETCVSALKLYTTSVAYAPCPSEQLTLAYANRSAVLKKLCKYEECIQDIDRALALSYPDNLKFKLYLRKAECLEALKHSGVEDTVKEAQQWLEKMSLDERSRKELNGKLMSVNGTPKSHKSKNINGMKRRSECPLPKIQSCNPKIPCATDAVAINYNEQYGRHVVATRKINPGEIIAIEKPYSLILSPNNVHTHCSYCLEVSWANIPCDRCVHAMYCSEECKASDWKHFHDMECSVFPSLFKMEFTKLDLFSLRLATQAVRESSSLEELREELKKIDSCDDPRTKGFSENGIFESDKYRSLLGLVTNTEKRTLDDLFRRSIDACFILYFLATCTNMFGSPLKDLSALVKNADVSFVGGLILRHQQMIPCNVHSVRNSDRILRAILFRLNPPFLLRGNTTVTAGNFSEECGLEAVERGIAAMPFFSLINHSCASNVERHSRAKHMIIYNMYPIEKGEQLFDSYSQHYAITPKVTRQKELLKQYHFTCQCIACQEDWPLFYNLKSFRELVKTKKDENKINHVLRKFNTYVDLATNGNIIDKPHIVDDLLQMITVIYNLVPMPCEEMNNVVETLKRVYDLYGNKREIPKLQAVQSA